MSEPPNSKSGQLKAAPQAAAPSPQAVDWWENFAKVVENPNASTYDYLRDSVLKGLELDGAENLNGYLSKAQQKAVKEVASLTDLKELRDTIKRFESNKLFFDYKTRVGIQCARVILDTYLSAREEYQKDMDKRKARGQRLPSSREQEAEIKKIVDEKLAEGEVAEKIEEMAQLVTGKDKEEIQNTVKEASNQLRERSSLRKISRDITGISKKYMTVDNVVNIGVHALPLLTWQYKWAIAVVFGAYVSRMAVYHGYKAAHARIRGDKETAQEQGQKTLTALKAAGGNVLAIAISPVVGKLPAKLAIWGTFAAGFVYNKSIEAGQYLLRKKQQIAESETTAKTAADIKGAWQWTKKTVAENIDSVFVLTAKTLNKENPNQYTDQLEKTSKRVRLKKARSLAGNVWMVTKAAGRRLKRTFNGAAYPDATQTDTPQTNITAKEDFKNTAANEHHDPAPNASETTAAFNNASGTANDNDSAPNNDTPPENAQQNNRSGISGPS